MACDADGKAAGYDQVQGRWLISADGWCWRLSMPMEGDLPMIAEEGAVIVGKIMMVCRSPRVDKLMFSINIRVCFVYGFYLVRN